MRGFEKLPSNIIPPSSVIDKNVRDALAEDIGSGDIHRKLIPNSHTCEVEVVARQPAVLCGSPWGSKVLEAVDPNIDVNWLVTEGSELNPDRPFLRANGNAASLLTAERSLLNFIQLLSATATITRTCVDLISHTQTKILDTRKTIPGLRHAQKYAVAIGGGTNHRMGLYDAYLIKENHIRAAGSLQAAVEKARNQSQPTPIEVEVENLDELSEAVALNVDRVLLDNFSLQMTKEAVHSYAERVKIEASGGVTLDNIVEVAETGVDYISMGLLTKDVKAIDLSMSVIR